MKKAFSLIELSVVILIIGILISGITLSSTMIKKSKLSNAQLMTARSGIDKIPDLGMWIEATSADSFLPAEALDGKEVSLWNDLASENVVKNNATASTTARPTYIRYAINDLPALRYNGSTNTMAFNGSFMINRDYTVFVVEQENARYPTNYFFGGTTLTLNQNLVLGYRQGTEVAQANWGNGCYTIIPATPASIQVIHAFSFDRISGKYYEGYINNTLYTGTCASQIEPISAFDGAAIGRPSIYFFNGDIGEVIIFTRRLRDDERKSVQKYLSKKWNIGIGALSS